MDAYEKINLQLQEQLAFITHETSCPVKRAELSIPICINALDELKRLLKKHAFKAIKDEIYFFKNLKPKITSKLIFNLYVFNIEMRKPQGSGKQTKKYYVRELKKITRYTEDNIEFFQYFRSDSVFLDEKYFVRGKVDLHLLLDCDYFNYDASFNTSHDHIVSKILAFDLLTPYLCDEINKLDNISELEHAKESIHSGLTWTDTKSNAIELIYALYCLSVFDNGRPDIKEIASYFERTFNIDLGDYYRAYLEIRNRKTGRTKFIQSLQEALTKRMDESDEKS